MFRFISAGTNQAWIFAANKHASFTVQTIGNDFLGDMLTFN